MLVYGITYSNTYPDFLVRDTYRCKEDRVEHYGESSQKEQNKDAVKDKSVIIIYDNKGKVDFILKVESIFCLRFS